MGMIIYVVAWKTRIKFPWFVYFLISLALLIHTSGYIQERYIKFVNWDVLAHTVSGTIVALLGFLLILYLDRTRKYNLDAPFIALFIVLFGTVCEYFWEVWEFFVDTFFGGSLAGPMQANNTDTMTDMIFVLVASLIVGRGVLLLPEAVRKGGDRPRHGQGQPLFPRVIPGDPFSFLIDDEAVPPAILPRIAGVALTIYIQDLHSY